MSKNLSIEKSIEYIDIGGPSMLRAAAKNLEFEKAAMLRDEIQEIRKIATSY